MGFANGSEIYVCVVWLPICFCFLCVDLKLGMYEIGVPRDCVILLYLGCGVGF